MTARRHDARRLLVAAIACSVAGCGQTIAQTRDAGLDAADAIDAGADAVSRDADDPRGACVFVPDASGASGIGGTFCFGTDHCAATYAALVDGGVAFGACNGAFADACAPFGACLPGSGVARLPDGGADPFNLRGCCGNGDMCTCDEICWSPDGVEPPHCIPIPIDAGR